MIPLNDGNKEHTIQIGSNLDQVIKKYLISFLQEDTDVFTWTPTDLPDIDPKVMTHQLSINLNHRPIKQKKRSFVPEQQKVITKEVDKLLDAGFIRKVIYPSWITNVVLVKKMNGK